MHYKCILIDKYTNIMLNLEKKMQLNTKVPFHLKLELEEVVLNRRKKGENTTLEQIITEYLTNGLKSEKTTK